MLRSGATGGGGGRGLRRADRELRRRHRSRQAVADVDQTHGIHACREVKCCRTCHVFREDLLLEHPITRVGRRGQPGCTRRKVYVAFNGRLMLFNSSSTSTSSSSGGGGGGGVSRSSSSSSAFRPFGSTAPRCALGTPPPPRAHSPAHDPTRSSSGRPAPASSLPVRSVGSPFVCSWLVCDGRAVAKEAGGDSYAAR